MPDSTAENLATVISQPKQDWKAVAMLLISVLVVVTGVAWYTSGQIVKGAADDLSKNTGKISTIETKVAAIEAKANIVDQKMAGADKRMDELLAEFKTMNSKIGTVAESQARMEGYILGKK